MSEKLNLLRQAAEGSPSWIKPYPKWLEKIRRFPTQSFPDDTRLADLTWTGKPIAATFKAFLQDLGLAYRESEDVILAIDEAANPLVNGKMVLPPKESLTIAEFRELLQDREMREKLALFSELTRSEILIRILSSFTPDG